jgi:hypothetical protein
LRPPRVTETITVASTGAEIRHGLLRDFPTGYKDPYGNRDVVGFQVLSATRDSANEPFRVESYLSAEGSPPPESPTIAGRLMLDRVKGFKMFLGKVEGNRLNRTAPQQTPEVFERYLPYALALDVEQHWAEQFSGVLGAAGWAPGSPPAYVPSFYSGSSWNGSSGTNFASSFSSSFISAISSSSAAPASSSGSAGGGSGGGGGRGLVEVSVWRCVGR